MKQRKSSIAFLLVMFFMHTQLFAQWKIYDGSYIPDEPDADQPAFKWDDKTGDFPSITTVMDDPDIPGNKVLKIEDMDGTVKESWRMKINEKVEEGGVTVVMRARPSDNFIELMEENSRFIYLGIRNGSNNAELSIEPKGTDLSVMLSSPKENYPLTLSGWQIYRMTLQGDEVKVYLNENEVPILEGTVTSTTGDLYFKFGDNNTGKQSAALYDWIIWDENGAYAPGEGSSIPEGLSVSYEGEPVVMQPEWKVYDGSYLPNSPEEDAPLFSWDDKTGDTPSITTVVDDPAIEGNKLLQIEDLDGTVKESWRMVLSDYAKENGVTVMMRAKPSDNFMDLMEENARFVYLGIRNGSNNAELSVDPGENDLNISLSSPKESTELDAYGWQLYRMTLKGGEVRVYLNENETPVLEGTVTNTTNDLYFKFGDNNTGRRFAGLYDWIIWDESGAYAPGEGASIPEELSVSYEGEPVIVLPEWNVYDGSYIPNEADTDQPLFTWEDKTGDVPSISTVIDDTDIPGNKVLKIEDLDGTVKESWRMELSENAVTSGVTVMMRARPSDNFINLMEENSRFIYLGIRNGSNNAEVSVEPGEENLNILLSNPKESYPLTLFGWQIYRMTLQGDEVKVYLNENETPILEGTVTNTSGDLFFKFGDNNTGRRSAALYDWIIWDESGAYAPGEGASIPDGLSMENGDRPVGMASFNKEKPELNCYPNPVQDRITLSFYLPEMKKVRISLYNSNGQKLKEVVNGNLNAGSHSITVPMEGFVQGVYWFKLETDQQCSISKVLVK